MARWDAEVVGLTRAAQEADLDPVAWSMRVAKVLGSAGAALPSPDLARVLVSHVCWENNVPAAWKYLEKAVDANLAPPMLVVALLSTKVFTTRFSRPAAYRLYMEILKRHLFSFTSQIVEASYTEIIKAVDDTLYLSHAFGIQANEAGILAVEFIVYIVCQLLDASLEDERLVDLEPDQDSRWMSRLQKTEVDQGDLAERALQLLAELQKENTIMAIEIIGLFLHHKVFYRLLSLARQNIHSISCKEGLVQRLHLLGAKSLALRNSTVSPECIIGFSLGIYDKSCSKCKSRQQKELRAIFPGPLSSFGDHYSGARCSAIWMPLDLYLEDCIDGTVTATNAIKIISGLLKAIQSINMTTWHDAFLALWIASLRLVQRESVPTEGPVPHTDTRLCILLSITPLSICEIINEDQSCVHADPCSMCYLQKKKLSQEHLIEALISSLKMLGDYETLLAPPPSITSIANQAAAKAMVFVSGFEVGDDYSNCVNEAEKSCSGNLWHLIVESCIARHLLDTSAYYWPGYVEGRINQTSQTIASQLPGWPSLMEGLQLTSSIVNTLINIPASSLAELEKIFDFAVNGSDFDRVSAASVLCGASLIRGWNIQEYTVRFVVKLLRPPAPMEYSGSMNYLISHGPVLNILLTGISSVDCVQIFSFHGFVPEIASALTEICEIFGSCSPNISWTLPTGEEISPHTVFSNSFILLLRLWKFNQTPLEHCLMGDGAPVGSQLTLDYLLLLRNSQLFSSLGGTTIKVNELDSHLMGGSCDFVLDSYPRLKVWYRQHQACLASTLSGLRPGTPVHQNVDNLLSMMFRKINSESNQCLGSGSSTSCSMSASASTDDDTVSGSDMPAWDILEAVPFVVDAALTALSHGRLSPRELATGLKELTDFLPACLATIISYFSSEVTRGVWKPANMNGTDWPSPAANLCTVEENIKKIVAATGVDVPSLVKAVSSHATLPLPLAAFATLTITYKLDKASIPFLNLAGPALENLAASCPWPSMPIVAALWVQKVKRWGDFLTFSASRTVFIHNHTAAAELLKSCFVAALGLSSSNVVSGGPCIGNLLGHDFASYFSGGLSPIAPGILYLRIYRTIRDVIQLSGDILSLLIDSVREIAANCLNTREKLSKTQFGMKYGRVSLASASRSTKVAASLAATLIWLSGGSSIIQWLFLEILPSWFLSIHDRSNLEGSRDVAAMLEGYALAYFSILCGKFAWTINPSPMSQRRKKVIEAHMAFLADAMEGKISLGCSLKTWRAYVLGYVKLMVGCAPNWVLEVEPHLLKRVSIGLRQWNEEQLAFCLLTRGGIPSMVNAVELIIASG